MASDSNRTDAIFFTLRGNAMRGNAMRGNAMRENAMRRNAIPQMTTQMMTPDDESRVNALRVDSLLTSYIDTQFLLIESSLNNLKKKFSTSAWNDDDRGELETPMHMFYSIQDLITNDHALYLKNAARVRRVDSLVNEVVLLLTSPRPTVQVERENAPDVRPQAENARQTLSSADRNQISPKAEAPPQSHASMSEGGLEDDRFRKPIHPRRAVHSEKEMAVVAELTDTLAKRNAAAALASGVRSPTKACFQTLNPYVV
jgi:hypothetical protein